MEIPAVYGPSMEIQNLGEGEVLGWSWFIEPYDWDFQARTEEDTELLEFDGDGVLQHCEDNASFGYEVLKRFTRLMLSLEDVSCAWTDEIPGWMMRVEANG